MNVWEERSLEAGNLLNPAFLSVLVHNTVRSYQSESQAPVPFTIPFLTLPLVLHKKTREALPRAVSTTFASWISRPEGVTAKLGFPRRARSLVPFIKDALLMGLLNNLFLIENGNLVNAPKTKIGRADALSHSEEFVDCLAKAGFCGRWLSLSGPSETILALMGVRP